MNRPRFRKILSDLWGNQTRSLLVTASITVGLFALGVIATIYAIMSEDMRLGYAGANPANIQLQGGPFDEQALKRVRRMPGVEEAQGEQIFHLRLSAGPDEWIQIEIHAPEEIDSMRLNQLRLAAGTFPPADHQIVLERYKLANTNAGVGDVITLELADGRERQLEVVGVVSDQTLGAFAAGPGFFLAPPQGFVTPATAEWLGFLPPGLYNTLYLTVEGDRGSRKNIEYVADNVLRELEISGYPISSLRTRSSFDHPNRVYVDALIGVLALLGLFTVFLSGFLITNTLQALMKQQVQQIGIMKSLGARRRQIVALYLSLILIFGLLAAVISIPLSAQVAFNQVRTLAGEVNFNFQGPRLVSWVIALQAGLAILAPLAAALVPVLQGARISVQQALSGVSQDMPTGMGRVSRLAARLHILSRPLLISVRNAFRQKSRMLLTLITLALGGALFIGAFNVQTSMNNYVEKIGRYFQGDVNVTLTRPHRIERVAQAVSTVAGVAHLEGWAIADGELINPDGTSGESVQVLGPPASSALVEPILLEGRWIIPGDTNAVAVNERFASLYPGLQIGDAVRMTIQDRETEWIVVGFFQLVGNSAGNIAYTSFEELSRVLDQPGRASTFRLVGDRSGMTEAEQELLGKQVEAALAAAGIRVAEVQAGESLSRLASDGFAILTAFLFFLAILTALVGSIGLAGTMSMNVLERTREIGVMRAIGATNSILMRMVIVEGLLIGLLSWVLGSLLAFPISKALSDAISQAIFSAPSTLGITPTGFLIWLGAVVVLSSLASLLPARHATRLTIREVLAYE